MAGKKIEEPEKNRIISMMDDVSAARDAGRAVKQKGGRLYTMVQDRVEIFRRGVGDTMQIQTELIQWSPEPGGMIVVRAVIRDGSGQTVATGHAEEIRGANYINETSALENCETSAIGRALAVLGLHGGEFASADEIVIANEKREKMAGLRAPKPVPVPTPAPEAKPEQKAPEQKAPVQTDLVQAVTEAGGKQPSVNDAKIMEGLPQHILDVVETINGNMPVLRKVNDPELLEMAFETFIPLCSSVDECYSFWHLNEHSIQWLQREAPKIFNRVKNQFVEHKAKLTEKAKQ